MILAIDAGNTRIKWGVWAHGAWRDKGSLPSREAGALAARVVEVRPDWVGVSCVADGAVRAALQAALACVDAPVFWLRAEAEAFGVRNGYRDPASLGADRWANLVACRRLGLAPCVVASLGTAATVDALAADGRFLGGVILPGAELMRRALHAGTAGVPAQIGEVTEFPRSTGDGVETGITLAWVGAVQELRARLAEHAGGEVGVVLTGGDADRLLGRLSPPVQRVEDLVLEGLLWMARDLGVRGV